MLKQDIVQGRYDKVIREIVDLTKQGYEINKSPSSIQLLGAGIIRVYVEIDDATDSNIANTSDTDDDTVEKVEETKQTAKRKTTATTKK